MTARRFLWALAVVGVLVTGTAVGPARAGQGPSERCSDGATRAGGMEVPTHPIVDTLVTVGLEAGATPYVQLCFSTTPKGNGGGAVVGGWVEVFLGPDPYGRCDRDTSPMVVGVDCRMLVSDGGTPSRTLSVTVTLQDTTSIGFGAEVDDVACLRGATLTTPAGTTGPFDVGVCA